MNTYISGNKKLFLLKCSKKTKGKIEQKNTRGTTLSRQRVFFL
jgi:hypothetical protein